MLLDGEGIRLHHRAATTPGSSASPVFDWIDWSVIAVHSTANWDIPAFMGQPDSYVAREGAAIAAIQKAAKGILGIETR
jgi:hypothetical protein